MEEKRYILATQDYGAFIGTAAEIVEAWFSAAGVAPVEVGLNHEKYFYQFVIPNQDGSYAVYALDDTAANILAGKCWHCLAV